MNEKSILGTAILLTIYGIIVPFTFPTPENIFDIIGCVILYLSIVIYWLMIYLNSKSSRRS